MNNAASPLIDLPPVAFVVDASQGVRARPQRDS
jgi:hypothetical protein